MGLFSKLFGVETKKVDKKQFIEILDSSFLDYANTDEDYNKILSNIKPPWYKGLIGVSLEIESNNGKFRMVSHTTPSRFLLNPSKRYWIFIQDLNTMICYEYSAFSGRSLKKDVATEISLYKSGLKKKTNNNLTETSTESTDEPSETKFCGKCGQKVTSENSFCPNCGNKIS